MDFLDGGGVPKGGCRGGVEGGVGWGGGGRGGRRGVGRGGGGEGRYFPPPFIAPKDEISRAGKGRSLYATARGTWIERTNSRMTES